MINSLNYGEMFAVNRAIYAYRQTGESVYTSMNALEQAVLNVQGMDVDIKLIDSELIEYIKKRYSLSVILMYIWRNKLLKVLGEEKCLKYEEGCKDLKPSYCYNLLHFNELDNRQKKNIRDFLKIRKKYTLKQYVKYYFTRR